MPGRSLAHEFLVLCGVRRHVNKEDEMAAEAWNGAFQPAAHSRLVKFFRVSEALCLALVGHAEANPLTLQYFYMPQTGKLDALYNRLARKFERGDLGVPVRCVTRPASDEGGFYGFERI